MSIVLKGALVLGGGVGLFTLINGFGGLYKNPSLGWVFPLGAIVIELGVLIWALRQTATVKRYWGQVGTGTLIAATGGLLIIVFSLLFTMALFPDYQEFAMTAAEDSWRDAGMTEDQIQQQLPIAEMMVRPVPQAIMGYVMTVIFGFGLSLIVAAFVRNKD